jgi:hypothetical protein
MPRPSPFGFPLLEPLQIGRFVRFLPQFVKVFYRLMRDERVSFLAKMVPVVAILLMLTPPAAGT